MTSKPKPKKKGRGAGGGRPTYKPTQAQRDDVRAYKIVGYSDDEISTFLEIDRNTLTKHFGEEIAKSRPQFLKEVGKSMGRMAIGAPAVYNKRGKLIREEVKPQIAACIYILKTQMKDRWSERVEHTGENGSAIPIRIGSLNDAQLDQFIARLEKTPGNPSGGNGGEGSAPPGA